MKNFLYILFSLASNVATGQSFRDCSTSYTEKFKKIELERMTYKITQNARDSVVAILDAEFYGCALGKDMGDFNLVGISGKTYTPENLRGKVVQFNFWSLNCGPCVEEIPMLNRLKASYKENNDFVLISVLMNDHDALDKLLERGSIRGGIRFEVVPNNKTSVKENFGFVKAYPTNLFVDKEGKIYMRTIGGIQNDESLEKIKSIIDAELSK